jgi:predicted RNA-binding Zn-ribbon protein involved in translation (DUF1610 family)
MSDLRVVSNSITSFCPNCGTELDVWEDDDDVTFFDCPKCGKQFDYITNRELDYHISVPRDYI